MTTEERRRTNVSRGVQLRTLCTRLVVVCLSAKLTHELVSCASVSSFLRTLTHIAVSLQPTSNRQNPSLLFSINWIYILFVAERCVMNVSCYCWPSFIGLKTIAIKNLWEDVSITWIKLGVQVCLLLPSAYWNIYIGKLERPTVGVHLIGE